MLYSFYKYQGTGNDFVIIDNRSNNIELSVKAGERYLRPTLRCWGRWPDVAQ